jgi:hypothetical protein
MTDGSTANAGCSPGSASTPRRFCCSTQELCRRHHPLQDALRAAGVEPVVVDVFDPPHWLERKAHRGIYNIAEPNGYLSIEKVRRVLGFDPNFRLSSHA